MRFSVTHVGNVLFSLSLGLHMHVIGLKLCSVTFVVIVSSLSRELQSLMRALTIAQTYFV